MPVQRCRYTRTIRHTSQVIRLVTTIFRGLVAAILPEDHDPYLVVHLGDLQRHGEIPLPLVADPHSLRSSGGIDAASSLALIDLPLPLQLAIELQIADVAPRPPEPVLLAVDVVQNLRVGEVAVEGEDAGDFPLADPVDQFAAQLRVVLEGLLGGLALLLLAEAAKLQRIVLSAGADVVDEQVVMGDLVAGLGVVPEPATSLMSLPSWSMSVSSMGMTP